MKKAHRTIDPEKLSATVRELNPHLFAATTPAVVAPAVPPDSPAKPTRRSKQPNRTEAEFQRILEARMSRGEFASVQFEAVKLRIGANCYYAPDFTAIDKEGRVHFFEVKGAHVWDDSLVKFKAAKERYPWANFEMHQKKGGKWTHVL